MTDELGYNIISFVAHGARQVEVHRHHCFQIVVSIKGSFACTIGGNSYARKKGFIVNQTIAHSCQAENASVIVYFIDAESYHGWQLKEMLGENPFLDIEAFFTDAQASRICAEGNQHLPKAELKKLADEVFGIVLPADNQPDANPIDERIIKALNFIETNLSESISLEDLADLMRLSPERARHLFARATGSPFSQYILWKRIK
jgi:YesN/AraC family two-component response regulator